MHCAQVSSSCTLLHAVCDGNATVSGHHEYGMQHMCCSCRGIWPAAIRRQPVKPATAALPISYRRMARLQAQLSRSGSWSARACSAAALSASECSMQTSTGSNSSLPALYTISKTGAWSAADLFVGCDRQLASEECPDPLQNGRSALESTNEDCQPLRRALQQCQDGSICLLIVKSLQSLEASCKIRQLGILQAAGHDQPCMMRCAECSAAGHDCC